jgi:hypothetical protein
MRHSQSEKLEIIRVVEDSSLGVKGTLRELDINRSTFYEWYRRWSSPVFVDTGLGSVGRDLQLECHRAQVVFPRFR